MSGGFQYIGPGPAGAAGATGQGSNVIVVSGSDGGSGYTGVDFTGWGTGSAGWTSGVYKSCGVPQTVTVGASGWLRADWELLCTQSGTFGVPSGYSILVTGTTYSVRGPVNLTGIGSIKQSIVWYQTGITPGKILVVDAQYVMTNGVNPGALCQPTTQAANGHFFDLKITIGT